jgi:hypothetical protein
MHHQFSRHAWRHRQWWRLNYNPSHGTNEQGLYGVNRIAQVNGPDIEYFLGDALGTVRQLADMTGTVTLARNYDPYGQVLSSTGTSNTPYGFTGEYKTVTRD